MLQGMVQAALGLNDAALGQQETLQELLASAEKRAATAAPAELGSLGINSTKLAKTHIKVSRKCLSVHMVSLISVIVHSHSMLHSPVGCVAARPVFVRICTCQDLHGKRKHMDACTSCRPATDCLLDYNLSSTSCLPYGLKLSRHSQNGHNHWGKMNPRQKTSFTSVLEPSIAQQLHASGQIMRLPQT